MTTTEDTSVAVLALRMATKEMITTTPTATKQFIKIIAALDWPARIRFSVNTGGCSGLSYQLGVDEQPPEKTDQVIELDGFEMLIDGVSMMHVMGTVIDWQMDDRLGYSFQFNNPLMESSCGCGESFSTI